MMDDWYTMTEVNILTDTVVGYTVHNQTDHLPIDIVFDNQYEAEKLANWLNEKEEWINRLEYLLEYKYDEDIYELKEKHEKHLKGIKMMKENRSVNIDLKKNNGVKPD